MESYQLVFVHGIGNQPTEFDLAKDWQLALFGKEITNASVGMWVNRERYPSPKKDSIAVERLTMLQKLVLAYLKSKHRVHDNTWTERLQSAVFGLFPALTVPVTKIALPDVHDWLALPKKQHRMQMAVWNAMNPIRNIVIAHSLGTVIAYDFLCLGTVEADLFVTLGSPLGLDIFHGDGLVMPPKVKRWINIADRMDPVAFDGDLSNNIPGVENYCDVGLNKTAPTHPHSVMGYLLNPMVGESVERFFKKA